MQTKRKCSLQLYSYRMKKIFILTGEPSGDKLASIVISEVKKKYPNIKYLCVGGENLASQGISSLYNLKEITYLGFTNVLCNIFKIKKKINMTAEKIIEFDPDILFSVDSPDFTLRVAKKVKLQKPKIKTVHFVAPQIWAWRKGRVKKIKSFIDHILLLFPFEKKFFDKEKINSTFVGHPLLHKEDDSKIDISQIIKKDKKIFSIFPGSRISEVNTLIPIIFNFIKLMNDSYDNILFVFHCTSDNIKVVKSLIAEQDFKNCEAISNVKIKSHILKQSFFALAKSGTISLEICNAKIPSIIIYKMNKINFFIIKMLVKVKYANIINIAAGYEVIPELLQSSCNPKNIYNNVNRLINDKDALMSQVSKSQDIIKNFKVDNSQNIASAILINYL